MGCEWGDMLEKIFVFCRRELQDTLLSPGLDVVMGDVLQFCPHTDSLRMKPTSGGNQGEVGPEPLDQASTETHLSLDFQVHEPRKTFEPRGLESFVIYYTTLKSPKALLFVMSLKVSWAGSPSRWNDAWIALDVSGRTVQEALSFTCSLVW